MCGEKNYTLSAMTALVKWIDDCDDSYITYKHHLGIK